MNALTPSIFSLYCAAAGSKPSIIEVTFPITYPKHVAPTSIPKITTPYSVMVVPTMSPNPTVVMVVNAQYSEMAYRSQMPSSAVKLFAPPNRFIQLTSCLFVFVVPKGFEP